MNNLILLKFKCETELRVLILRLNVIPEENGVYERRCEEREGRGAEGTDQRDEDVEAGNRGRHANCEIKGPK